MSKDDWRDDDERVIAQHEAERDLASPLQDFIDQLIKTRKGIYSYPSNGSGDVILDLAKATQAELTRLEEKIDLIDGEGVTKDETNT